MKTKAYRTWVLKEIPSIRPVDWMLYIRMRMLAKCDKSPKILKMFMPVVLFFFSFFGFFSDLVVGYVGYSHDRHLIKNSYLLPIGGGNITL